jgi:phosphohistidine phosphatase
MKTLFLLRHAKSSWKDKTLADSDRPLNSRGKRAAETMGAFLRQQKVRPDLILSSSAKRARETIEIILRSGATTGDLRFDERIYEASADRLLEVVTEIDKPTRVVLIVGHNPGLEELITRVTGESEVMPTAALAKIDFKISTWDNASTKTGSLEWIVTPKQLEKG